MCPIECKSHTPDRVVATQNKDIEALRIRNLYKIRQRENRAILFELAVEEAIRREKNPSISNVIFRVFCDTKYGQDVFLVGSEDFLGKWNPDKAAPLSWKPGNVWECTIPLLNRTKTWEYKFIVKEYGRVEWETVHNRILTAASLLERNGSIECRWNVL